MIDDIMIKKASDGDREAFEKIANYYQPRIFAVCLRVLKSESDAHDACQNALLKLFMNIGKFKFDSSFSTWVYSVAKNSAIDFFRKKKKFVSIDELGNASSDMVDVYSLPEQTAILSDSKNSIISALNAINSEQRTCIVLKDIEGYSIQEIAEILDISEGTVKSRLHRGRALLRELLSVEGD